MTQLGWQGAHRCHDGRHHTRVLPRCCLCKPALGSAAEYFRNLDISLPGQWLVSKVSRFALAAFYNPSITLFPTLCGDIIRQFGSLLSILVAASVLILVLGRSLLERFLVRALLGRFLLVRALVMRFLLVRFFTVAPSVRGVIVCTFEMFVL